MEVYTDYKRSRILLLCGLDGLILGVIFEMLYGFYYHWEFQRAAYYAYEIGAKIAVERGPLILHNRLGIPALYFVAFLLVGYILPRILRSRPWSLLVFFQLTALSGVTLAVIFYFYNDLTLESRYLAQPSARHSLLGILWTWLACLLIACFINVFYWAIVQALHRRKYPQALAARH